ncbi:hypothetical protein E4U54_006291, partial [Claviceps lovelessii]
IAASVVAETFDPGNDVTQETQKRRKHTFPSPDPPKTSFLTATQHLVFCPDLDISWASVRDYGIDDDLSLLPHKQTRHPPSPAVPQSPHRFRNQQRPVTLFE